jgi:hypothetical protein
MIRPLESIALGIAALLVSAGLLIASAPLPVHTVAPDRPCPFLEIVIL